MQEKKPYKTGNPALNAKTFDQFEDQDQLRRGGHGSGVETGGRMTLQGTVGKCYILLLTTSLFAGFTMHYAGASPQAAMPLAIGGGLIGFILALVIIFKQRTAPVLSMFYAAFEGLFLGGVSARYEADFPGIVMQTIGLTAGIFLALLFAYSSKLVRPSENFKLGLIAATGGIALLYVFNMIMTFGFHMPIPMIHDSGPIGIGFSIVVVIIAAMNLVLDFDFIESGVERGAPKYMEWYSAFGLLVTLVWLYMEILRLISKARK
ncbi:MAG: Bax inhibitor-1/YccA family protein [Candidatus Obscuribacterales bacterium]|nr:Bax inhibitor-1/YccA family protein [Candidatus Obscuribacterales bacterium]